MVHEKYEEREFDKKGYHDIALIEFDKPFDPKTVKGANLMPICLPPIPSGRKSEDENKRGGRILGFLFH